MIRENCKYIAVLSLVMVYENSLFKMEHLSTF